MITFEELKKLQFGEIFASGETVNSTNGIYSVMLDEGDELKWIAKKSNGDNSWAIYFHFKEFSLEFIKQHGLKLKNLKEIKKLVPCDDKMLTKYRH